MNYSARSAGWTAALLIVAGGGFVMGRAIPHEASASGRSARLAPAPQPAALEGGSVTAAALPDFRDVAKKVVPAVVTVRSQKTVRVGNRSPFPGGPFGDDLFEQFFGMPRGRAPSEDRYVQRGLGSGVIVNANGTILTNNHVVDGVDKVEVVVGDGKSHPAKILGTDPQTDLAVLKIDALGLQAVEMGDSDALEVGEWVLAVGNPFSEALGHTVTAGIVSAKGRSNLRLADYEDFIQTDAAINPGNSGGALVDTRGRLVGINTAIVSGSGGYQGVGFAIPINMARSVMNNLIENGKVVRGWIGLTIQDLTPDLAEAVGLAGKEGALVAGVQPDSPAAEVGLRRGDVITALDGQKVGSNSDLRNRIAGTAPGTRVALTVFRDGKETTIKATLGELPGSLARGGSAGAAPEEEALGISVQPLTRDLASRLGYEGETGLVVSQVEPGSAAGEAGLREGDLIKEVNRHAVTSIVEYRQALSGVERGKVILLLVRRGDAATYITLRPRAAP